MGSSGGLLLMTLGAILILAPLTKSACRRLGVPALVGYILIGLIIGDLVRPLASSEARFDGVFEALAQLGVVALLFRVGLRSHTSALLDKLPQASLIWIANVLGSVAIGYVISRYGFGWSVETSLVIATAFSATSVAVSVAVWDELNQLDSDQGQMLIDVAELDDLSAAVLLAVLLGTVTVLLNGDDGLWTRVGTSALSIVFKLALFIVGCYVFAHFLEPGFTRFNRELTNSETSLTISILGAGLAIAAIAAYLGFSVAIGALFAGLAFSRDPDAVHTDGRFVYFYDLLTPFFFIHIGMQTDLSVLTDAVGVGSILFFAAALAKLVSTIAPALISMSGRDALTLGISMVPRAEIALVVVYACRELDERIVPPEVFAAMVVVSLATCVISPVVLRRMLDSTRPS